MARDDSDDDDSPPALEIATRLERLGRLLRQAGHAGGLVPAQWEVLRYLARANRLSRSPGAVARYLGTTKGTVSQSLLTLTKKGLVTRRTSAVDERQVLLDLTEAGRAKLASDPLQALARDLDGLGGKTRRRFARGLSELLGHEIDRQKAARFGTCEGCAHRAEQDGGPACRIDKAPLDSTEQNLLCASFTLEKGA